MLALRNIIKSHVLIKPSIRFSVSQFSSKPHIRNRDLFEKIVKNNVQKKEITIQSMSEFPIRPPHGSYIYNVRKIAVTYHQSRPDKNFEPELYTKYLLVKEQPAEEQAAIYGSKQAAKNEIALYNEILPVLHNNKTPRLPVPTPYYLHENLIVLDDPENYTFETIYNGPIPATPIEMAYVIMDLAKIHGASLIAERIDPHSFAKVRNVTKEILYNGAEHTLIEHQDNYLRSLIKYFTSLPASAENMKIVDILEDLKENSVHEILKLLQQPSDYSVMCHGALGSPHIMMNENGNVMFTELCQMRYSSLASDVSYLLYTNMDPNVRVHHCERLLNMYLAALHQVTSNGGVDVKNEITAQWLENEMKKWELYGLLYGLWSTPMRFDKLPADVKNITREALQNQDIEKYGPLFKDQVRSMLLNYKEPLYYV